MKKIILIVNFLFIFSALTATTIEQVYYFDDPVISQVDTEYHIIQFPSTMQFAKAGQPVLPYHAVSLLLPPGEEAIHIEVIPEKEVQLDAFYTLYPMQHFQPISRGKSSEFVIDQQLYNDSEIYPKTQHGSVSTHYMNGYGFAFSTITPVKYVPKTSRISYFKELRIIIHTAPAEEKKSNIVSVKSSTRIENKIRNIAQNQSFMSLYSPVTRNDAFEVLLITPLQFENDFDDLVAMYLTQGLRTEIVTVEDINLISTGIDLQEKIRNYIKQEYQDHGIEHVILCGDVEHVPYRGFYCEVQSSSLYTDDDIPSDLYYSALDGTWNDDGDNLWGEIGEDDLLPDVSVGRISFSNSTELSNVLNKSMMYQESPVFGELDKPLLAGEDLYSNPQTWGGDYLDLLIGYQNENGYITEGIPTSQDIETLYDRDLGSWSISELITKINSGKSYVHHSGHANQTYCMRMNSNSITNTNFSQVNGTTHNYSHVYTHGCLSGSFDYNDCIAEEMVNLENFAASFIGNSRYGWFNEGQTEGPSAHLHREYVNALYTLRTDRIGEAHMNSKVYTAPWVNAPGQHEEGALRWCFYCCNVLGDPVMPIWTDEPIPFQILCADSIFIGQNQFQVAVSSIGTSTQGLVCTLMKEGVFHGKGIVDASGTTTITVDPIFTQVGNAQIIVTGYNALKTEKDLAIIPSTGAYVIIESFQTKDDNNNLPEYSEEVSFDFTLANVGTQDATNVTATLSSDDNYITCSYSAAIFGTITAGSTATQEDVLPIVINDYVPDQHISLINMNISSDNKQSWDTQFPIILNAPVLEMGTLSINDSSGDNDGILDPGETVIMTIPVINSGHAISPNADAVLNCSSSYITIQDNNFTLGQIDAGTTQNAEFILSADPFMQNGTSVTFDFDVNANEYSFSENFEICIGLIIEDFETGNFSHYNWYFAGNADWTIDSNNQYEGIYCAKTGAIGHQSSTSIKIDIEVFSDSEISFWKKVSSENNYDYLEFYIDDSKQDEWSGEVEWSQEVFSIPAGSHTLEWRYDKDWYVTGGQDCAWIDYIIFPPLGSPAANNELPAMTHNFLEHNFPNPFSQSTSISYAVKSSGKVSIHIYNILGQKVTTLIDEHFQPGVFTVHWDGKDSFGVPVNSGVYFYRMDADGYHYTRKMIIMK